MYKKAVAGILCILFLGFLGVQKSSAASLNALSDTISTSRPSAAAPLGADSAAAAGQATIFDNNAVFLQGDSVTAYADPVGGETGTADTGVIVASMSAAATPSSGKRIVYFTNTITHVRHQGDALVVPITAVHTISFKPVAVIPVSGKIVISFPQMTANDTNPASPSASAFQLGGFTATTNIKANFSSGSSTCNFAISGTGASGTPTITCTIATASVASGVTVTILIGCSSGASATCATANQVPTAINPMKLASNAQSGEGAATTQADTPKISVQTQDNNSITLDKGTAAVGIIESVQVQAQIDPTLTFQITGIANGTNINSGHGASCPSETTNSGISPNATFVNLGTVGTGITIAAQDLTVSTNGQGGYSITATSSGHLNDAQNNYNINDSTTYGTMTAGTELFGVHPCGTDAVSAAVPGSAVSGGGGGKVAWPTATTSISLASRSSTANAIVTTVEYAITAAATTPAGLYTSIITYVATPTFN